jgi:hypothetical protein
MLRELGPEKELGENRGWWIGAPRIRNNSAAQCFKIRGSHGLTRSASNITGLTRFVIGGAFACSFRSDADGILPYYSSVGSKKLDECHMALNRSESGIPRN